MGDWVDFARGPALQFSIAVFVAGVLWRLVRLAMMPDVRILSVPRNSAPGFMDAVSGFFSMMLPHRQYTSRTLLSVITGWVFHVGLLIIVVGLAPHILFIKGLTGLSWPNLPSNLVFLVSVVTLVALVGALVHRLTSPVLRLISTTDDYVTWAVTTLPVVTGIAATMHLGPRYETLLTLHILSICLFLIWFPFGKLMHAFIVFISRGTTGRELARRGVKL